MPNDYATCVYSEMQIEIFWLLAGGWVAMKDRVPLFITWMFLLFYKVGLNPLDPAPLRYQVW